ncbi:MAG: hopanoid biosynthesis associated radical SAM protein HpnJ, partial [Rhizomicrobium sp.]
MKSLFLQAPSFDGYDGGAGARYQMKREVKSFWFPTWLAQAAAMVPGSRLIDAPPHRLSFKDIEEDVKAHELIIIHTSTPSFKSDVRTADMVRAINPTAKIGFIGAKVAVEPEESLKAAPSIDFVCRNEYEFTVQELANGAEWSTIKGLSYRDAAGKIVNNPEREILMDMDQLPSVLPMYKQLKVENYFGGYLMHPYMSWYTGRGCKSRCTFCLWPQTIGGHKYRYKSIAKVVEEVKYVQKEFPQIREIFFDDDTLTDDHDRVEEL